MDENIVERKLVEKFAEVVSMLNVSKYNDQAEYRKIVGAIYWEIFIREDDDETEYDERGREL
tara:strand:- start:5367 stop:5552 length:186 start_codon:yes stop_codon:yes gene_type:complete